MFKIVKDAIGILFMVVVVVITAILMIMYWAIKNLVNFFKVVKDDDSDPKNPTINKLVLQKPGEFKMFASRRLKNV